MRVEGRRESRLDFRGSLSQEIVWIGGQKICSFKLAANMMEGGTWEIVNYTDRPALLKRKVNRFGVDSRLEFKIMKVDQSQFMHFKSMGTWYSSLRVRVLNFSIQYHCCADEIFSKRRRCIQITLEINGNEHYFLHLDVTK